MGGHMDQVFQALIDRSRAALDLKTINTMEASTVSEPTAGPDTPPTSKGEAKFINLALQGGGAHGAFTWGVLDRLLEDDPAVGTIFADAAAQISGAEDRDARQG